MAFSKLVTESKSFRNPVLRLYFAVSGSATKRMDEIIQKSDKYLSILRPEYYLELNEPLDDSQLDQIR